MIVELVKQNHQYSWNCNNRDRATVWVAIYELKKSAQQLVNILMISWRWDCSSSKKITSITHNYKQAIVFNCQCWSLNSLCHVCMFLWYNLICLSWIHCQDRSDIDLFARVKCPHHSMTFSACLPLDLAYRTGTKSIWWYI